MRLCIPHFVPSTRAVDAARELTLALRSLRRRPSFTIVCTATLALGIGATVAIFTVVNSVLLRPLPYPEADRIVTIRHHAPGINLPELQSSPGLIDHYRASSTTLTRIAGYEMRQRNLTGSGQPERVRTVAVTPELFDALAVRPAIGRAFAETDARGEAPLVGILTDACGARASAPIPLSSGARFRLMAGRWRSSA